MIAAQSSYTYQHLHQDYLFLTYANTVFNFKPKLNMLTQLKVHFHR